ncbi:MAG: hypothetical protein K0Q55_133 [Verrucomicrobia bacterium]|nr:hypothetical protein [Verrucomicrobiota bacterium]
MKGRPEISPRIIIQLILILGLSVVMSSLHATNQIIDPIVWKGETFYPMPGPSILGAFPEKEKPQFEVASTSNWKGYEAEWEIKDNTLLLLSLKGRVKGKHKEITELLPGKKPPIPATWYSGTLILPRGKEIGILKKESRFVHEKETHLTFEKGRLVKTEDKTFDPKKTPVWK